MISVAGTWNGPNLVLNNPLINPCMKRTVYFFEELMQLLHPFMPFVTEEIYHLLGNQPDDLCVKQFASINDPDKDLLEQGGLLKELITGIRDARVKNDPETQRHHPAPYTIG